MPPIYPTKLKPYQLLTSLQPYMAQYQTHHQNKTTKITTTYQEQNTSIHIAAWLRPSQIFISCVALLRSISAPLLRSSASPPSEALPNTQGSHRLHKQW